MNRCRAKHWLLGVGGAFLSLQVPACGSTSDIVFSPLQVEFVEPASEGTEATGSAELVLRLNGPSEQSVTVQYVVTDIEASGHDDCGSRDYSIQSFNVEFEPGETEARIQVSVLDDDVSEIDERLLVEISDAQGAVLGPNSVHERTILDDDRGAIFDVVRDFGATADDDSDDTRAIQAAVDRAELSGQSVIVFPPGEYVVGTLRLAPGVSYYGYSATLVRRAMFGDDTTNVVLNYSGASDSELTVVQGLTLDGNREAQGPFQDWELQESSLMTLSGNPSSPGRLRVLMEDVTLQNMAGNGAEMLANVDASLCQVVGSEVWTDMLRLDGGNSSLSLRAVEGGGNLGTTGISLAGGQAGYADSRRVEVELERVVLVNGDLEVSLEDGSTLTGRECDMAAAPFYLRAVRSRVSFIDSSFFIGAPLARMNRLVAPNDVLFQNCSFLLTEEVEPTLSLQDENRLLMIANVVWDDTLFPAMQDEPAVLRERLGGQSLVFDACEFNVRDDVESSDSVYVAGLSQVPGLDTQPDPTLEPNVIVVQGATMSSDFDDVFAPDCGDCRFEP